MYLKSISIKNYRKFGEELQKIEFAHDHWQGKGEDSEEQTEKYISKSSTLMVGKNNSGKTTVLSLLKILKNTKCNMSNVFNYTDFNLNYLRNWYDEYIFSKSADKIKSILEEALPFLEFNLEIGIDDEDDVIGKFEDILILGDISAEDSECHTEDVAMVNIRIRYEVNNKTKLLELLSNLVEKSSIKISKLDLSHEEIGSFFSNETTEVSIDELRDKTSCPKIKRFVDFYDESNFRKFLEYIGGKYYILNFYPDGIDIPAKDFSLSSLLKVKTIDANTVKDGKTLSNAYNKIVTTYIKNHQSDNLDDFISQLNFEIKNTVDDKITQILQNAVTSIESVKNLKMNLKPDIDLQTIFNHGIIYEYQEDGNYIPENQFGLGYTNLMVIISEIVDYIELYSKEDINGAINILSIEEPESFMHPQMQELFIKNISKAIATLLGNKKAEKLDTFQIIITTHSSSILNSKIQSGNTLDNIVYLGCGDNNEIISKNIRDSELLISKGNSEQDTFEYIKKYLRLEATDIFYADAVILVEGVSEESYIRYLIDKDEILNKQHIKVYRIDGAYAHQFRTLLRLLDVKTIIFTDLDLKRFESKKEIKNEDKSEEVIPKPITDLKNRITEEFRLTNDISKEFSLTTNVSINAFVKSIIENSTQIEQNEQIEQINKYIVKNIDEKEVLKLTNNKISLFTQGKINGNYATSFEEAIVLTNSNNNNDDEYKNKKSLIQLLQYVHPRMKHFEDITCDDNLIKRSYMYQVKLSDAKSKFSTGLVFLGTTDENFEIRPPKYIDIGLQDLREHFSEESNE